MAIRGLASGDDGSLVLWEEDADVEMCMAICMCAMLEVVHCIIFVLISRLFFFGDHLFGKIYDIYLYTYTYSDYI